LGSPGTSSVVGTDILTYSTRFKESGDFWDYRVGMNKQVGDTLAPLFDGYQSTRSRPANACTGAIGERGADVWDLS
jgi:hypothetical protein